MEIVKNPIGQRDDNSYGNVKTEGKGRNQVVVSYSGAHPWRLEANTDSATNMETGKLVIDRQPSAGIPAQFRYDQLTSPSIQQYPHIGVGGGNPLPNSATVFFDLADRLRL